MFEATKGISLEPTEYAAWKQPLYEWESVPSFVEQPQWHDGIHIVTLPNGNHLDVLLQSDPLSTMRRDSVAVFFSGALPNRAGKPGPYFSGVRVAQALAIPFVAFSDPSLNFDSQTPLGWYAGSQGDHTQDAITQVLKSATMRSGRNLLLVGGSGGGFASLYYAHRVGSQASAFVWNPQTSIIEYEPNAVKQYFDVAVPNNSFSYNRSEDKKTAIAAMESAGIETVLPMLNAGRVFYLQNSSDWHVAKHLKPFLSTNRYEHRGNGLYSNDRGHSVAVSNFGSGHAVPPLKVIHSVIREMLLPARSTRVIYNELINTAALSHEFRALPQDMRKEWEEAGPSVHLEFMGDENNLSVSVNWGRIRPGTGGIKVSYSVFGADTRIQHSNFTAASYDLKIDAPRDMVRVEATFVDGFENPLGTASIPNGDFMKSTKAFPATSPSDPLKSRIAIKPSGAEEEFAKKGQQPNERASLRIFVYGSCVSRDAFEEPDAPTLVDYRARSSVGSAFGPKTGIFEKISIDKNPSAFQRRMVGSDLNKELAQALIDSSFDYLLVDFIDERLQLIRSGNRYDTYSPELSRAGFEVSAGNLVEPGSDEYMAAFQQGWNKLLEIVPAEKIRLNRVFWASVDEDGKELKDISKILDGNRLLRRLYAYALSFPGIQSIDYPDELIRADAGHKWGPSPFHFTPAFYRQTIEALGAISKSNAESDGSMLENLSTTILVETMFCDYEQDSKILEKFAGRFLLTLESVASQRVPNFVEMRYIVYISSDKVAERTRFETLLTSYPEHIAAMFHFVAYDHPQDGYGYSTANHADLYKNPNKHAPRRDRLFDKALAQMPRIESHHLIRIGLDDDDVWQPWQVAEVVRIASAAYEQFPTEKLFVLGLQNSYLCYVDEEIEVDEVKLKRILTGNKFTTGPTAELQTLKFFSPWSIPETFNENSEDRMRRVGFRMLETSDNQPGWVYMRWGDNLTQARKDSYYEELFGTTKLSSIHDILALEEPILAPKDVPNFGIRPREFEVVATRDALGGVKVVSNKSSMVDPDSLSYSVVLTNGTETYAAIEGCETDVVAIDGVYGAGIFAKVVLFRDTTAILTTRSRGLV